MKEIVKIVSSPFNSDVEIVGNIILKLHVPYSDKDVTLKINPSFEEYQENFDQQDLGVRQLSIIADTDETKTLAFDFQDNNVRQVKISGEEYHIKLLSIGAENLQGQDFPNFVFLVTRDDK